MSNSSYLYDPVLGREQGLEELRRLLAEVEWLWVDWWKTQGTAECETWHNPKEPIVEVQRLLNHRLVQGSKGITVDPDDKFVRYMLVQSTKDPELALQNAAREFGCTVPPGAVEEFERRVLDVEEGSIALYGDVKDTLKAFNAAGRPYLGVLSNIWAFPTDFIFGVRGRTGLAGLGMARFFKKLVLSCEAGFRKPEREIYEYAAQLVGVADPKKHFLVDDSVEYVRGAIKAGWKAAYIDRQRKFSAEEFARVCPGAILIHQLTDLLPLFGVEPVR